MTDETTTHNSNFAPEGWHTLSKGPVISKEIKVLGDWAWMRSHLQVSITQPDGKAARRSGYTLTILRKNPDGAWVIARDANLLTEE